ncbi:hypothetical protein C3492_13805 [Streptomyces sp. Ru62]|uniref:hypothetical protein n=1 Tax=Streptomyces sp. Ru62 TaxID=2080745 RepID=UPI000CDDC837|nr:hypothetical protein [Streptomyces sp. Ru62]POX62771.1 hypothetical protein C3492_13805 [Streptomyces sp. Ru62]
MATAYAAARTKPKTTPIIGVRAISQAQRAFALAFTGQDQAIEEIDLAHQLLTGLVLRVTRATVRLARSLAGRP